MSPRESITKAGGLVIALLGGVVLLGANPGACVPIPGPTPCAEICGETVCGVDGVTYTCGEPEAVCAGVAVAYPGVCSNCVSDYECGPNQHCSTSDGECLPAPGCLPGDACPDVCGGVCVDDAPICYGDEDCGNGEECVYEVCPAYEYDCPPDSLCAPPPCAGTCQPAASCDDDTDCGPGEACVFEPCPLYDAAYCPADTGCPPCDTTGTCEPVVEPACRGDEDCGSSEYCNILYCTDCAPGTDCLGFCEGVCEPLPGGCDTNADCGWGEECIPTACPLMPCEVGVECPPCDPGGVCVPVDYCYSDSDCAWGHCSTSDGDCLSPCGPGETCPAVCAGICVNDPPPPPPLYDCNDAGQDCPTGLLCNLVVCEAVSCVPGDPCPPAICWGYCDF